MTRSCVSCIKIRGVASDKKTGLLHNGIRKILGIPCHHRHIGCEAAWGAGLQCDTNVTPAKMGVSPSSHCPAAPHQYSNA